MTNDDLKTLQECKLELFMGIGKVLASIGLEHLEVAGLELEPSSLKISKDNLDYESMALVEPLDLNGCEEGYVRQLVTRVDPSTGNSYQIYICVPINSVV